MKFIIDTQNTYINKLPPGANSLVLANILNDNSCDILYVSKDEKELKKIINTLNFFSDIESIYIPEWNSMPYDRVSPSSNIITERINAFYKAITSSKQKVILTTINSIIQKTLPRNILYEQVLKLQKESSVKRDFLIKFLNENGFKRVITAREAGEFSVRGSIIDIFSVDKDEGYRIDFFGDLIDSIKLFDPVSQISKLSVEEVTLMPVNEIIFKDHYIENFKKNFITKFGVKATNNIMYESVSNNQYYPGIENWLPLFYDKLESIFNYFNGSIIIFDHLAKEAIGERYSTINEYYNLRLEKLSIRNKLINEEEYYPIEPDDLWISNKKLDEELKDYKQIFFNPFESDSESNFNSVNYLPNFISESKKSSKPVIEVVKDFAINQNNQRYRIIIACASESSKNRVIEILKSSEQHYIIINSWDKINKISPKTIAIALFPIEHGFIYDKFIIVSEQDLFGEKIYQKDRSRKKLENYLSEAASLNNGELVVHKEHGIGRFEGLETLEISNSFHDCLKILYHGGDKLYLPVENIDLITRYGSEETGSLDKLGGVAWQTRKAKLKNRIKIAAEELLKIAAKRHLESAPILIANQELYGEFCAKFPYVETEDQLVAIKEIEDDLSSGKAMDRLICGDVGFGKTEIALRAAFITVKSEESLTNENRLQVAIIAPTTILAKQHYKAILTRFEGFGVNIAQLSRLTSRAEAQKIKTGLKEGNVDIVVGTHALLAKNMEFKNLSLLIVDEEQHFGVAQKERLKQLKANIHILTLSATPIPRTLQMSLTGIRDLSLIATPPVDRLAVRTFIMPYDGIIIKEAILREYYRNGKIFYVAPRVSDLADIEKELKILVPEIKIVTAHGQMPPAVLDDIMNDFYEGKYDLLISTTIVESGLDVPSANTIIIHRADMLGLSQLYQLRGRVGRGKIRAFAYLTVPAKKILKDEADRRLKVMQTLDSLGAGFSLASHDMDIRGFGNLIGDEQSGHIKEIGIELYQDMLKEAVAEAKALEEDKPIEVKDFTVQINIGLSILIPENYINDISLRLGLYRRVGNLEGDSDIESFKAEMIDRFGALPEEFENLLLTVRLKKTCKELGINKLDAGPKGIVISFHNDEFSNPDALLSYVLKQPEKAKLRADQKLVLSIQTDDPMIRYNRVNKALVEIQNITRNS